MVERIASIDFIAVSCIESVFICYGVFDVLLITRLLRGVEMLGSLTG